MQTVAPSREVIDIVKEEGGDIVKLCYQCGLCTATCPWNTVRSFPIRRIMHQAQLGLPDFEDEDLYIDKPPEETQRLKDFMRIRDDYFLEIPEDLKPQEIENKLAELKTLCRAICEKYEGTELVG